MKRLYLLLVATAAAAVIVPTVFAGTPNGNGLYGDHWSSCTGASFSYEGYVTLVPGNGNSFWVNGHHLVILSADVTPTNGDTYTYSFGQKTGQAGDTVTCTGDFPGYHVVSHDIVVP